MNDCVFCDYLRWFLSYVCEQGCLLVESFRAHVGIGNNICYLKEISRAGVWASIVFSKFKEKVKRLQPFAGHSIALFHSCGIPFCTSFPQTKATNGNRKQRQKWWNKICMNRFQRIIYMSHDHIIFYHHHQQYYSLWHGVKARNRTYLINLYDETYLVYCMIVRVCFIKILTWNSICTQKERINNTCGTMSAF